MAVQLDHYRVHRLLARGGMANVYLASPLDALTRAEFVAIKRIRPELKSDEKFIRMFMDELSITRQLNHPNIACLLNWGESKGLPYLVMEFVPGVDIHLILTKGPMPVHLAIKVAADLGRALDYAHDLRDESGEPLGIVHRDVTPHNVMVTFEGRTKLLDFGIALAKVRAERTRTGVLKGKWAFMAPEQIAGEPLDRRSDIFTLGTLLYEMLTARRTFQGDSPAETLSAITFRDPTPPSKLNPAIPQHLDYVLATCMAKKPEDRYQRALDVALALEEIRVPAGAEPPETLKGYVYRCFPDRYAQVEGVIDDIEESFNPEEQLAPIGDDTVVAAAPFLRSSADLEDEVSEIDVASGVKPIVEMSLAHEAEEATDFIERPARPRPVGPAPNPGAWPSFPAAPATEETDDEADDDAEPPNWKLIILLGLGIGLFVGLGVVIAAWYLLTQA